MTTSLLAQRPAAKPNPPEELRTRLLAKGDKLQVLPAVAIKALSMAKDPKCLISEFASVVERDVRLASDILRVTNSVVYAAREPIVSLRQAVVRLGFAHCRNVILAASLASVMRRMPLSEAWMQAVLWRHAVLTGLVSVRLNRMLKLGFNGEEFAAGLIHDVGRSLIGVVAPNQLAEADPLDFEETGDILERERIILRTDHCDLGGWFMMHSKLPDALVEVVRFHHNPSQATVHPRLVALTAVADDMANHLQRCNTADGYEPETNPAIDQLLENNNSGRRLFVEQAVVQLSEVFQDANSENQPFGMT